MIALFPKHSLSPSFKAIVLAEEVSEYLNSIAEKQYNLELLQYQVCISLI